MKLGLIGIKKNINIAIREKFSISDKRKNEALGLLLKEFDEAIILNTCNRTEIYVNHNLSEGELIKIIFSIFKWNQELRDYIFYKEGNFVTKHIFQVACGYHSKITGENQILGQIKGAFNNSLKIKGANKILGRLFQDAIACGKKFRTEAKLYEIPISSISIVINKFIEMKCKRVMVLGYGEVGSLAIKYLLQNNFQEIYLVVRDIGKVQDLKDNRIRVIDFKEKNKYINNVDGIISCTKAPHTVINKGEVHNEGNKLYCFDMAVPRDIDEEVLLLDRVCSYNIDEISKIDDKNKRLRLLRMEENKWVIDKGIIDFNNWMKLKEISPFIKEIKENSEKIYKKRIKTYHNKKKEALDSKLVEVLIKSTSDFYLNRAIDLLKEEKFKGCEEECMEILRKIFLKIE